MKISIWGISVVLNLYKGQGEKRILKCVTRKSTGFLVWGKKLACRLVFNLHRTSRVLILSLGEIAMK